MNIDLNDLPKVDSDHGSQRRFWRSFKWFNRRRLTLVLFVAIIAAAGGAWGHWLNSQFLDAKRSAARSDWDSVVDTLDRYLRYRPNDAEALLLIAEAYVSQSGRGKSDNLQQAVFHLQKIKEASPLASRARLQEARVSLLLQKKPGTAERLLRDSLRLNDESLEANLLMWQLLDLTGRHISSDPYFWQACQLTPERERGPLLRDWFLSEFYPDQLYSELYAQMRIAAVGKIPASVNLMVQFREVEPSASFLHAAIAEHFHGAGNLKGSIELLNECPDISAAMNDPFFVSVLFETLVDLGEFQKAEDCFKEFPEPHEGYVYWRSQGMYFDYVQHDSDAAVAAYRKALETPPSKFDWGLMTRLSVCLKKTNRGKEAEQVQARVENLTRQVLTLEHTSLLRNLLMKPMRAEDAAKFVDFYGKFGLDREVSAWSDYKAQLEKVR
jgi:tetratricopeptide (TPR) repeat protein